MKLRLEYIILITIGLLAVGYASYKQFFDDQLQYETLREYEDILHPPLPVEVPILYEELPPPKP